MVEQIASSQPDTITLDEWTTYILNSRNDNSHNQTSILNELMHEFKGNELVEDTTSSNLNIHDATKLNEVQLRHAINIASHLDNKGKVRRQSHIQDLQDLNLKIFNNGEV